MDKSKQSNLICDAVVQWAEDMTFKRSFGEIFRSFDRVLTLLKVPFLGYQSDCQVQNDYVRKVI